MKWLAARAFLGRVPWQVWAALAACLAAIAAYHVGDGDGYARREAEQAEIERKALEKARGADAAAGKAVQGATDKVERENDEARAAANGSDDPLKSGLDSLRRQKAGSDPSAR